MTCSVNDCERPVAHRGLCHAHYKKLLLHGDPLAGRSYGPSGRTLAFIERAQSHTGDDCLLWPFAKNNMGYGRVGIGGNVYLTHRVVCEAVNGPPPFDGAEAAHTCGNGHLGCVAGGHLIWKTREENSEDMVAHGRSRRGEKQHASRLTEDDVRFIWVRRDLTSAEIARHLNVCSGTVVAVRARKSWRWLTDTFSDPTLLQSEGGRRAA